MSHSCCWLPAPAGHSSESSTGVAKASTARAGHRGHCWHLPSHELPFGDAVCGGWQLPVPRAGLYPPPCCAPTLLAAVRHRGQSEQHSFLLGTFESSVRERHHFWKTVCHRAVVFLEQGDTRWKCSFTQAGGKSLAMLSAPQNLSCC